MTGQAISQYEVFLYLSYLPQWSKANLDWLHCDFDHDLGTGVEDERWWIKEGVLAWKNTMKDVVANTDGKAVHVLPLSGGLDSRIILGGLLENLSASQIVATTYGIPGAWDLEIAKRMARKFGIRHEVFDLTNETWDVDKLAAAASHLRYPVNVYQHYVRRKINEHFGKECVYWSGFMGDALAGSYLPNVPNVDKKEAVRRFVKTAPTPNYKSQSFQDALVDEMSAQCPWERLHNRKFTLDQQIDMGVRQYSLHQPIVIVNGFDFKTPFLTADWGNFISNVPYQWLLGFHLYKRIIALGYPELAGFPVAGNAGMPLLASRSMVLVGKAIGRIQPYIARRDAFRSHPRTNYINWAESLCHRGRLQETVYATIQDLKKRQVLEGAEIDGWWTGHQTRKADYSLLLLNLSSMELLLRAGLI
jgi:asparagine synthetase B (glutamine-hydrolysing)